MAVTIVLTASVLLQAVAAWLAYRLSRSAGARMGWALVAAAALAVACGGVTMLLRESGREWSSAVGLGQASVVLAASALLVAGLAAAKGELRHERYLLRTLMDNLPHNIYFKDANSRFTRINRAMANYFGLPDPASARDKTDRDFFTEEHAQQALADEREILQTGQPIIDKEEKETWPDGHATWALTTKMPLYDEKGRIIGTFGISRDITERRLAEQALREAKEAAEAASIAKSTFLANMSHEIRTPLNAVIGMTELVLDTPLAQQQREFLAAVRDSGEALLSLINDILDFSKIEAGKLALEQVPFDLADGLGDILKSFAVRAHRAGLELACKIHPDTPATVVGDYHRLRQIVVNLVGNAIKFTERGEVVLTVEPEALDTNSALLHFTIRDTGIGIPEDKLSRIFDMFEQVDGTLTRRHGGAGLGLAIASRLVGLMGGRVWVESRVGQGSCFHFTARFGVAKTEEMKPAATQPEILHDLRVLVVDDNATNRLILDEVLRNWRMSPAIAASAREGLELMREACAAGNAFRLVLTDVHMPDIDGFTFTRLIKEDDRLGSTVVMMLTSGDRTEDVAHCEQLGVAAYLLKPVKQSELLDAIKMALGIESPPDAEIRALARQEPRAYGPLRVLLAEDSLVNQKLAVAFLEGHGHQVAVAGNGREAVAASESQPFDLILMDVQMPEMDGLEATARIRAREQQNGGHVPIVAMTAHALKGDRERCLAAGMDGYVAKPIRLKDLLATLDELFADHARSSTPHQVERAIDWNEALRSVHGDPAVLRTIIEASLEETPGLVEQLRRGVDGCDPALLRRAAHTLKGSLRYFGARHAVELAERLEKQAAAGDLSEAEPLVAAIDAEVARVAAAMRQCLQSTLASQGEERHE